MILVAGDHITDVYHNCNHLGRANEDPCSLLREMGISQGDGGVGFVAQSIKKQGDEVVCYETSSTDIHRFVVGEKNYLSVEQRDWTGDDLLPGEIESCGVDRASIVVIWDDSKSNGDAMLEIFNRAKAREALTVVDSNREDTFSRYKGACIFKISANDYLNKIKDIDKASEDNLVIITGAAYVSVFGMYRGEKIDFREKCEPVEIVHTIGAGDVFLARLVHCLTHHNDIQVAVSSATEYATESVKFKGCHFPDHLLERNEDG